MRVREGEEILLDIATPRGPQPIRLTVKWVKKVRRSDVQVGLEILEASEAAKQTLSELANALISSGLLSSNFGMAEAA